MKINKHSRSILEEINTYVSKKNKEDVVESRAQHVIASAIYLFEYFDQHFSEEESENLKNRFISSIKGGDSKRFTRAIQKIREDVEDE